MLTAVERDALYSPKPRSVYSRAGLVYERRVSEALKAALPGSLVRRNPWFFFEDSSGTGTCSPDILIKLPDGHFAIGETKLTYKDEARTKLQDLYGPVVAHLTGTQPILFVVAKTLTPSSPDPFLSITTLLTTLCPTQFGLVQWRGRGPI